MAVSVHKYPHPSHTGDPYKQRDIEQTIYYFCLACKKYYQTLLSHIMCCFTFRICCYNNTLHDIIRYTHHQHCSYTRQFLQHSEKTYNNWKNLSHLNGVQYIIFSNSKFSKVNRNVIYNLKRKHWHFNTMTQQVSC